MRTIEDGVRHYIDNLPVSNTCEYNAEENRQKKAFKSGVEFAQRWIPVEKELPEPLPINDSGVIENEDLLLLKYKPFSSLEFGVLRQNKYDTYWELPDIGNVPIDNITHWRPINIK
ncbi:MAG: hypothetical protein KBD57_09310 [Bacteroidia bacterium]|nr:hypothetical protein [Bacteroidia bacterium]